MVVSDFVEDASRPRTEHEIAWQASLQGLEPGGSRRSFRYENSSSEDDAPLVALPDAKRRRISRNEDNSENTAGDRKGTGASAELSGDLFRSDALAAVRKASKSLPDSEDLIPMELPPLASTARMAKPPLPSPLPSPTAHPTIHITEASMDTIIIDDSDSDPSPKRQLRSATPSTVKSGPSKSPSGKKRVVAPIPRPPPRPTSDSVPTSKISSPASVKGKGRKLKPRMSLEKAMDGAQKLQGPALVKLYPTISSYIDYCSKFTLDQPRAQCFTGCQVLFVNSYSNRPNGMSLDARTQMSLVYRHGGTLVKPEEFVAPPRRYMEIPGWETQAIVEGWTTHIIPVAMRSQPPTPFASIPSLIAPHSTANNLGTFVKLVQYEWVANSIRYGSIADEYPFLIEGDTRDLGRRPKMVKRVSTMSIEQDSADEEANKASRRYGDPLKDIS